MKSNPSAEYMILGALMPWPGHGYDILKFIKAAMGETWHVGTSQLYTLLKKMEDKGLVTSQWETQDVRPSKRIFSPTTRGRDIFLEWVLLPLNHVRDMRIEFLSKLYFIGHLSLTGGEGLVNNQTQILEKTLERLTKKREREKDPYALLVVGFKIRTTKAWLKWLHLEAKPYLEKMLNRSQGF
jgi:DNA-binding PadR family transcriptional regulator